MDGGTKPGGIGAALKRREDPRLLTGRGCYGADFNLPSQAHAAVLRSPHAHARILAIDTAEASAMPGVLGVLTGADWVAQGLQPMAHAPAAQSPPDIRLENSDGAPVEAPHQYPLAVDRARFVGEAVAFVVAATAAQARDAAERVRVEYEPLPAVTKAVAAATAEAPLLYEKRASNLVIDARVGDRARTDMAFARAAHTARLETWVQRVAGTPMEPRTALAEYDPASGRYTLYASHGGVGRPRRDLAQMFGVPEAQIRVISRDVGGNFGPRNYTYPEFALAVWAARRVGRPVKWVSDRGEGFLSDYQARDLTVMAELALDVDGNFLALHADNLSNLGALAASLVPLTKGTELMSSLYHVPVVAARARAVLSSTPPTAPYRSAGRPEVMYVMERLIDLAAREHGFDRVELRRRNLVPASAMPYANPFGMTYDSGDYRSVLDAVLKLADWEGFPARRAEAKACGRRRGIGLGGYIESQSGAPQERAIVTVLPEGAVEIVIGTMSRGQGHETSFAQLAGEWLGVPEDCVRLVQGDTERVAFGAGSHSGRSLRLAATTIHAASQQIIAKGRQIASQLLEAAEADIVFVEGRFLVAGTDRAVDLIAVARAAQSGTGLPEALCGALDGVGDVVSRVSSFPHGFHVAEVEIDPETGMVELVRYSAVDDVGRAVNPLILHGQTHGGIAQGAGHALWEQCVYDPQSGQLVSGSLMDYVLPRAADLPFFATGISEVPSTSHPLGFRGGGEGGITPALGVIVNAIVDALADLGVRHIEMPVTPERVWRAMREARS
ncbi:MAG TPA: xanthine dehydrogenase family protein molybdopterin-binding subunit [Stellaceae bacterium]